MTHFSSVSFGCVILSAESDSLANGFKVEGPLKLEASNGAAGNSTRAPVVEMPFEAGGCAGVRGVLRLHRTIRKRIVRCRSG